METIEWLTLAYVIVTAIGFVVILLGGIFAWKQLRGLKQQTGLSALTQIFEEFQSRELREDRHEIFQKMPDNPDPADIDEDLYGSIERVGVSYNRIGFLVQRGLLPMDRALAEYIEPPSIRMWGKLQRLVEAERIRRGEKTFLVFFEELAHKCQKELPEYKLKYFEEFKQDG